METLRLVDKFHGPHPRHLVVSNAVGCYFDSYSYDTAGLPRDWLLES